eukprot:scaffold1057_cov194-Skeletonema_menzelii.AAC.4
MNSDAREGVESDMSEEIDAINRLFPMHLLATLRLMCQDYEYGEKARAIQGGSDQFFIKFYNTKQSITVYYWMRMLRLLSSLLYQVMMS